MIGRIVYKFQVKTGIFLSFDVLLFWDYPCYGVCASWWFSWSDWFCPYIQDSVSFGEKAEHCSIFTHVSVVFNWRGLFFARVFSLLAYYAELLRFGFVYNDIVLEFVERMQDLIRHVARFFVMSTVCWTLCLGFSILYMITLYTTQRVSTRKLLVYMSIFATVLPAIDATGFAILNQIV